jgi:hypothetical protein
MGLFAMLSHFSPDNQSAFLPPGSCVAMCPIKVNLYVIVKPNKYVHGSHASCTAKEILVLPGTNHTKNVGKFLMLLFHKNKGKKGCIQTIFTGSMSFVNK